MKRVDFRILIGAGLIVMGALMLLERLGLFRGVVDLFWGAVFLIGGAYFLYRFASNPSIDWWAAIPGFALVGLASESLLPRMFGDWGGLFFLGALGLSFFAVYLSGRHRWWAIIPGGVLITLAVSRSLRRGWECKRPAASCLWVLVSHFSWWRWPRRCAGPTSPA